MTQVSVIEGAVIMMTDKYFQRDDDLAGVILEIIAHYQPIPTMNIWFELGEDDRFKDGILLAEVNDILSHLENRKRIVREDGDKWVVKKEVA